MTEWPPVVEGGHSRAGDVEIFVQLVLLGQPTDGAIHFLFFREAILKSVVQVTLVSLALTAPVLAQGLVDPSKVAPEYREAAEKRRAEQIRQRDCAKKAEAEKVMPRDRTAFLLHCLDEQATTGH